MRALGASRTSVATGGILGANWARDPLWKTARAVPSLDLRFADNKTLGDAYGGGSPVTFTRASSATYVDSSGVLRSATTNLLLRSEEFDTTWAVSGNNASVSVNQTVAPNGATTADKLVEDTTASAVHRVQQGITSLAAGTYTYSVFIKAAGRDYAQLLLFNSTDGNWKNVKFNIQNGTVDTLIQGSGSQGVIAAGNGWYRCWVTATSTVTANTQAYVYTGNVTGSGQTYTGDGTSGIYIWGAMLEQSSTVGEYIPTTSTINSAPRFDHNPTTGESLGLMVEEARTNLIRNNTMVGAVAGTPGTLPTNWGATTTSGGLTRQIVAVGTVDGVNYARFRISGTTSSSFVFFNISTFDSTAASTGQTWTTSAYYQLQAGSLSGVTLQHELARFGVASAYLGSTVLPFTPGSSALVRQRYAMTSTVSDATLTAINYGLQLLVPINGTVVDFTIDIGLPQLEQGAFATSVIPTTTATVTRAADVASITGSNFGTTRTNLLLRSEEFDNASWIKAGLTVTANSTTAPDGALTADTLVEDTANSTHAAQQGSISVTSGTTYTLSCYAKPAGRNFIQLLFIGGFATSVFAIVDITNGTVGTTAGSPTVTVANVGNGWYRISITATATSTTTTTVQLRPAASSGTGFYQGNGTSGIYTWGAMVEASSAVTPYIPTTTAAVSVFESSWYNQTEGTVFANWSYPVTPSSFPRIWQFTEGAAGDQNGFSVSTNFANHNRFGARAQNVGLFDAQQGPDGTVNQSMRSAIALKAGQHAYSGNGTAPSTNAGAMPSGIDRCWIGSLNNSLYFTGHIRRLTYFPTRLSNTSLQQITQP